MVLRFTGCSGTIFAERFDGVLAMYARHSDGADLLKRFAPHKAVVNAVRHPGGAVSSAIVLVPTARAVANVRLEPFTWPIGSACRPTPVVRSTGCCAAGGRPVESIVVILERGSDAATTPESPRPPTSYSARAASVMRKPRRSEPEQLLLPD